MDLIPGSPEDEQITSSKPDQGVLTPSPCSLASHQMMLPVPGMGGQELLAKGVYGNLQTTQYLIGFKAHSMRWNPFLTLLRWPRTVDQIGHET